MIAPALAAALAGGPDGPNELPPYPRGESELVRDMLALAGLIDSAGGAASVG